MCVIYQWGKLIEKCGYKGYESRVKEKLNGRNGENFFSLQNGIKFLLFPKRDLYYITDAINILKQILEEEAAYTVCHLVTILLMTTVQMFDCLL